MTARTCGAGPLLLLLHGTGATHRSWLPMVPYLARHFRLLMPDLPGHGESPMPDRDGFTLDSMVHRLGKFLRRRGEPLVLAAGHSAGAAILVRGITEQVFAPRGLVALNPALLPFPGLQQPLFSGAAKVLARLPAFAGLVASRAKDPHALGNLLSGIGSTPSPEAIARYQHSLSDPSHVKAVLKMMAAWDLRPVADRLHEVALPVLLLGGLSDRAVRPNDVRELGVRLPDASCRLLAGSGHLMHEESPAQISRILLEWFAQQVPVPGLAAVATPAQTSD
jgi:magnesium chelatase accessory protein